MRKKIFSFLAFIFLTSNLGYAATNAAPSTEEPAYKAFDGLSLGANLGGSINISGGESSYRYQNRFAGIANDSVTNSTAKMNPEHAADFVSSLEAGYSYAVTPKFLLGLTNSIFFESARDIRTEDYDFANWRGTSDVPGDYSVLTKIDPRVHFSVGVEPGYLVTRRTLLFGTLSYHYMNAKVSSTTDTNLDGMNFPSVITENSGNQSFNGIGFGGGVKYNLFKHCLLKVAGEVVLFRPENVPAPNYRNQNDEIELDSDIKAQPAWVNVMVGITYTFG